MIDNPTEQQAAVIEHIASGAAVDAAVIARAGSGKTSTLIHAVRMRPAGTSATLCAFNSRIADELKAKTRGWPLLFARTLHSLGMRTVNRAYQRRGAEIEVDSGRERSLAMQVVGEQEPDQVLTAIARLASSAKECAPDEATKLEAIERVGAELGILPDDDEIEGWDTEQIIAATAEVVARSQDVTHDRRISYADMLYVPLANRLRPDQSDLVVVDEAQDMNLAQLRLAARARRDGGRFVVVGDDRQAIYSWRGAAPGALERVRSALGAKLFRLTVTHRCGSAIVAEAQRIVRDITAAPGSPTGLVRSAAWVQMHAPTGAQPGDFVIGRTNAVLAIACLRLLKNGTPATIAGSDIGKALVGLVGRLSRGVGEDLVMLAERLAAWRDREVRKAEARKSENGARNARDKADTIDAIADECGSVTELRHRIDALFADDGRPRVICSTVHKAKGLEADRVWMLTASFNAMRPRSELLEIEEQNLRYVTITRARRELVYVDGEPEEPARGT